VIVITYLIYMRNITKISMATGSFLALSMFLAQGAFAATPMMSAQADISWHTMNGVRAYNLYYKEVGQPKWTHAVRLLSQNARKITINVQKGVSYVYNVAGVSFAGKEIGWTGVQKMVTK
jgi:hypothetical protein